jgi:hypothetical protein
VADVILEHVHIIILGDTNCWTPRLSLERILEQLVLLRLLYQILLCLVVGPEVVKVLLGAKCGAESVSWTSLA